jgi:hypothetical protein
MAKGHKAGGRIAGTPNRKAQEISVQLKSLGCNPVEGMAQIAMDENHTRDSGGTCMLSLRRTLYPKRKAVELAADPVPPLQSKLVMEFVRARPTTGQETDANEHTAS